MDNPRHSLGYVPHVTEQDLSDNIHELESRLSELQTADSPDGLAQAKILHVLLRNRRHLVELLKAGRFV